MEAIQQLEETTTEQTSTMKNKMSTIISETQSSDPLVYCQSKQLGFLPKQLEHNPKGAVTFLRRNLRSLKGERPQS